MERVIEIGKTYRHFKGIIVRIIAVAQHTERDERLVIYEHVENHTVWARPYDMFNSLVDRKNYPDVLQEYRFEEVK